MALPTAQQWLQKWGTNLGAAGQYIQQGVNNVTVAPGQQAAAAQDRWVSGIQAAAQNGTWARNVSAVSLQSWKDSMIKKGIPRLSQGIATAQANKVQQVQALLGAVATAQSSVASLPKGGLEQGIARATAFMRAMSAAAPKKTGSGQ